MLPYSPPFDPAKEVFALAPDPPPCDHPHISPTTDSALLQQTLSMMRKHNMIGVLTGETEMVNAWHAAAPDRFIKSIQFQWGRDSADPERLVRLITKEGFKVMGEISNQYVGVAPNDPRMEPFWSLAEKLDIPVQLHMGEGPAGIGALMPSYRASLSNPLLLEEVLARHPKLRLSVMHYGSPFVQEMIAIMGAWPQVYIEFGGIQWFYHREYFYRQLKEFMDAGLGKRIMFGSDHILWPSITEEAVEIVEQAPFLSAAEKQDIFYNNAARFLRLR